MGYANAGAKMKHVIDYLSFMLEDILLKNGVPFLTERDFTSAKDDRYKTIQQFIASNSKSLPTPDLFISGNIILDVYTGIQAFNEIKGKYRTNESIYSVFIVHPDSFERDLASLPDLFPPQDLEYLRKHFSVFMNENQYWFSCLKLNQIQCNEEENVQITSFDFPTSSAVDTARAQLLADVSSYLVSIAKKPVSRISMNNSV